MRLNDDKLTALEAIRSASPDGRLHTSMIVQAAADPANPLHDEFEWDDGIAGAKYRLQQARRLCRYAVRLLPLPDGGASVVKVYTHLDGELGYRSVVDVLSDAELRERMLATALQELIRLRQKYRDIDELVEVFRVIDKIAA